MDASGDQGIHRIYIDKVVVKILVIDVNQKKLKQKQISITFWDEKMFVSRRQWGQLDDVGMQQKRSITEVTG